MLEANRWNTLSNFITLARAPLALLFFYENAFVRLAAIFLAMLSDGLDGYVARRFKSESYLGKILDPLMDRIFIGIAFSILFFENRIEPWQVLCLLVRDLVMFSFVLYMRLLGDFSRCKPQATICGKFTTFCQFVVLLALIVGFKIPAYFFLLFPLAGIFLVFELFSITNRELA